MTPPPSKDCKEFHQDMIRVKTEQSNIKQLLWLILAVLITGLLKNFMGF